MCTALLLGVFFSVKTLRKQLLRSPTHGSYWTLVLRCFSFFLLHKIATQRATIYSRRKTDTHTYTQRDAYMYINIYIYIYLYLYIYVYISVVYGLRGRLERCVSFTCCLRVSLTCSLQTPRASHAATRMQGLQVLQIWCCIGAKCCKDTNV